MTKSRALPVMAVALFASSTALAQSNWQQAPARPAAPAAVSAVCTAFAGLSTTSAVAAGATNGMFGTPQVGETYVLSVSGPGSGSFRIVGDPAGAVTYAGPGTVPGVLSYSVTSSTPPAGAAGVGYYFDSGAGTVTITASCGPTPVATPAINRWGIAALGLLLALVGLWFSTVKRRNPIA